ncbi:hypothetical protein Vadar_034492 [Vaccinium darrowii]|uniref:Uncharacterized protein n=1 Tax=Vaccinium darrowii TaxID=229202 RepID=A0ACB7XLV7_9ERIC|nr:hypothetical protein Vadar_034492 [Vaccinium darrowii]
MERDKSELFTLFVDNIPDSKNQSWLKILFSNYGIVKDSFIPAKRSKRGSRFGFVRFDCSVSAGVAISRANGLEVEGYYLFVKKASFDLENKRKTPGAMDSSKPREKVEGYVELIVDGRDYSIRVEEEEFFRTIASSTSFVDLMMDVTSNDADLGKKFDDEKRGRVDLEASNVVVDAFSGMVWPSMALDQNQSIPDCQSKEFGVCYRPTEEGDDEDIKCSERSSLVVPETQDSSGEKVMNEENATENGNSLETLEVNRFVINDDGPFIDPIVENCNPNQADDWDLLKWQQREIIMFLHFGVNTFSDSEWGTGYENPAIFNPVGLNAAQWIETAVEAGVSLVILTAKHHDGFCLWPSKYTNHSVIGSPWENGHGDVIQELVKAAERGVDVGLYLSPWDRHDQRYGHNQEYNEYYLAQLQELLNHYGNVREIWFDGAKGANAKYMSYYFNDWIAMVRELQSSINIFSNAGPDVRWIGDENGFAGETCWSTINRTSLSIGDGINLDYLNTGDPKGTDWLPAECDVSIRPGWFWHKSESPKKLSKLLDIYYNSVGRNCLLLRNVPPNTTGLISGDDVQRLREFRSAIDTIFGTNLAEKWYVNASSQRGGKGGGFGPENVLDTDHLWTYWAPKDDQDEDYWIEFHGTDDGVSFNVVRIHEAIGLGQRIKRHEIYVDGDLIANGTTVGYKKLHRLKMGVVHGYSVKIRITESRGVPLVSSVGLHFDPFWQSSPLSRRRHSTQLQA